MAEGEGFEPPLPFRVKRFSRPPVSTAHTSLRVSAINSLSAPTASPNRRFFEQCRRDLRVSLTGSLTPSKARRVVKERPCQRAWWSFHGPCSRAHGSVAPGSACSNIETHEDTAAGSPPAGWPVVPHARPQANPDPASSPPHALLVQFVGTGSNLGIKVDRFPGQQCGFCWVQDAVGEQFHAVVEKKPHQSIAPNEPRPLPSQRRHKPKVYSTRGLRSLNG